MLQNFLETRFDNLSALDIEVFQELLAYEDNDLLDMVMGRAQPVNAQLNGVLHMMRTA